MSRWARDHGLSLVMFGLFVFSLGGQLVTGFDDYNADRAEHDQSTTTMAAYIGTGHFIEAVFENWESEFLQMAAFVVLTVFLRQRGSPESKPLDGEQPVDEEPESNGPGIPRPVRQGGFLLRLYENSLGLALFGLFFLSFALHAVGGSMEYNDEQQSHTSTERVNPVTYLGTSRFWFESFQNWQSEFMSVGALIVLSIFLRQKGSPESKPVDHPHSETGSD